MSNSSAVAPEMAFTFDMDSSKAPYVLTVSARLTETPKMAPACKTGFFTRFIMPCKGAVALSMMPTVKFQALPTKPCTFVSTFWIVAVARSTASRSMWNPVLVSRSSRSLVCSMLLSNPERRFWADCTPGPVLSLTVASMAILKVSEAICSLLSGLLLLFELHHHGGQTKRSFTMWGVPDLARHYAGALEDLVQKRCAPSGED